MDRPLVTSTQHTLPFESLSPSDFERLCFNLVSRWPDYFDVKHLGAAGHDYGQDVVAHRVVPAGTERVVVQCKRLHSPPGHAALAAELTKISTAARRGVIVTPNHVVFMVSQNLSTDLRSKTEATAASLGYSVDFFGTSELDYELSEQPTIVSNFFRVADRPRPGSRKGLTFDTVTPRHLGPSRGVFVNRARELALLDLSTSSGQAEPRLLLMHGPQGSGKSSLAREWASRHKADFPDGQLVIDFRVLRDSPGGSVAESVRSALIALGCPVKDVPESLGDRVGLYRTLTADLGLLVLLDDVRAPAEVTTLMPDSARSVTLVTSNSNLSVLSATKCAPVPVGTLGATHARSMLEALVSTPATGAEEIEARETILSYCSGLPLAIELCATRVRDDAMGSYRWLARDLKDESTRLARMGDKPASLEVIFMDAYTALPSDLARAYRLVGLSPRMVTLGQVAAALGVEEHEAIRLVAGLSRRHLVDVDRGDGGFDATFAVEMHDLLRLHARSIALTQEAQESDNLVVRMARYAVRRSRQIDVAISPHRLRIERVWDGENRLEMPARHPDIEVAPPDGAEAGRVFERERAFVLAALHHSAMSGLDGAVCIIADSLWPAMWRRGYDRDLPVVYQTATEAAARLGDDRTLCRMLMLLARGLGAAGDLTSALEVSERAVDLGRHTADLWLLAAALEVKGALELEVSGPVVALPLFEEAQRTFPPERKRGIAIQNHHIGKCHARLDNHVAAIDAFAAAVAHFEQHNDVVMAARTSSRMSESLLAAGRVVAAVETATAARQFASIAGEHMALGRALVVLARSAQDETERRSHLLAALAEFETVRDDARVIEVRALLA